MYIYVEINQQNALNYTILYFLLYLMFDFSCWGVTILILIPRIIDYVEINQCTIMHGIRKIHVHLDGPSIEHIHYHDVRNHEHQNSYCCNHHQTVSIYRVFFLSVMNYICSYITLIFTITLCSKCDSKMFTDFHSIQSQTNSTFSKHLAVTFQTVNIVVS
jgi:hypothetical protein